MNEPYSLKVEAILSIAKKRGLNITHEMIMQELKERGKQKQTKVNKKSKAI